MGSHRVSIYPVLSAVLAAPLFALARPFFALDETGTALVGKVAAALFSSLAAGVLFLVVGRRRPQEDAVLTAAIFALGTSVWSTSQALWQHPAAVLFLSQAVLCMVLSREDEAWAGRAGLPLGSRVVENGDGMGRLRSGAAALPCACWTTARVLEVRSASPAISRK